MRELQPGEANVDEEVFVRFREYYYDEELGNEERGLATKLEDDGETVTIHWKHSGTAVEWSWDEIDPIVVMSPEEFERRWDEAQDQTDQETDTTLTVGPTPPETNIEWRP